ncbi:MAG: TrkA family potassium uptake protein [Acidimicrobiia bacterium]|nr:TrkA family potassium uptake protein [Acidimicrobiia bacterium]
MQKRQFAVIGLGRFGAAMATTLTTLGHEVVGIDARDDAVQALADTIEQAVQLDATDVKALRAAGVQNVEVAVVSIGENIEASLLVVMQLREIGVKAIVAKAVTPIHGRILEKLGVTRVVFPEREMAIRLAHSLASRNVLDYVEFSAGFSIAEVPAPEAFVGRTLRQLEIRPRFGLTLIAVRRQVPGGGEETTVAPGADEVIRTGDRLALLGSQAQIEKLDDLLR